MTTPQELPGPAVSMIKAEPGTSRSPALRLPSFKPPRDMMLGGLRISGSKDALAKASRKVYKPNLNLQRKKNSDEPGSQSEQQAEGGRGRGTGRGRAARGRGERGRGRGRGRGTSDLVQSGGAIFAEGLAASTNPRKSGIYGERGSGGGGGSGTSLSIKSRIKTSDYKMEDPKESAARLSALLQDDFIDDPGMDPDVTDMPTQLPTLKVKIEKFIKQENKIKAETAENGLDVSLAIKEEKKPLPTFEKQEIFTMSQLLQSTMQQLVLLKLPDFMPRFESETDKSRPSTSGNAADGAVVADEEEEELNRKPTLPEGRVGKLQLLKSGRVRLVIGDSVLYTELGVHTSVKQDLILMDVDPNTPGGDMINLGPISARIISSPLYNPHVS